MRIGGYNDPIANFGRRGSTFILNTVAALPRNQRAGALRDALNAISPAVRADAENTAARMRGKMSPQAAMKHGIAVALANRMTERLVSHGKARPLGSWSLGAIEHTHDDAGYTSAPRPQTSTGNTVSTGGQWQPMSEAAFKTSMPSLYAQWQNAVRRASPINTIAIRYRLEHGKAAFASDGLPNGFVLRHFFDKYGKRYKSERARKDTGIFGKLVGGIERLACLATKIPGFDKAAQIAGAEYGGSIGADAAAKGAQIARDQTCGRSKARDQTRGRSKVPTPIVASSGGSGVILVAAAAAAFLLLR